MKRSRKPSHVSPFSIVDEGPFLAALGSEICESAQVQDVIDDMCRFNMHERLFICVYTFFREAEADGVGHFFSYDFACLYDQVLLGLEEIGAHDIRVRLERYVDRVFGRTVPATVSARQDAIDALDVDQDNQLERMVGDLTDGISQLVRWARAHQEYFRVRDAVWPRMERPEPNPILETAFSPIDAPAPGSFDDPREAWRKCVASLRCVVIDQADNLSVPQLKAIQNFSSSFYETKARNLLEIRKELALREIRFEPAPENFAQIALEALLTESVLARMEPLSEEEKHERLKLLDDLPPPNTAQDAAGSV